MIQTRWCVITGAPYAGKTTVINELIALGFKSPQEAAATYIQMLLAEGMTIEEITKDKQTFQTNLLEFYAKAESDLDPNEIVFLDRAMPDAVAYSRTYGIDLTEALKLAKRFHYQHVFLFERLPYHTEGVRIDDDSIAEYLDKQIEDEYRNLGYDVIRVPVISVEDRVQFILEKAKLKQRA
jgi:predicted ATPase